MIVAGALNVWGQTKSETDAFVLYQQGAKTYDPVSLQKALDLLAGSKDQDHLKGLICYRLMLISHYSADEIAAQSYGDRALVYFGNALKKDPKKVTALTGRVLTCQHLTILSLANQGKYNPTAKADIQTLEKVAPTHRMTLLAKAMEQVNGAGMFRSRVKTAEKSLDTLYRQYPDDVFVALSLGEASLKAGGREKAATLARKVLSRNRLNLWAKDLLGRATRY